MKNPEVQKNEEPVPPFNYQILHSLNLPAAATPLPNRFDQVINARKSVRDFRPLTLQQIGDILWYTAKVKTTWLQDNGYILTHRGSPSAGARHPIDILVSDPQLLAPNYFYYYNPFAHSLNQLANLHGDTTAFSSHVNQIVDAANATVFWFLAHPARTSAKYEHAESLIWRDAGALINAIQLVCTAMELNSCPIGSLGEPFISDFFEGHDIFGAGGLLIG